MDDLLVRQERVQDYQTVDVLIQRAFESAEVSDHTEHYLVERLRMSEYYVPELSIVAETDGQVVGHILLSPIIIRTTSQKVVSLALAPLSVLPDYQRKGVGRALVTHAHQQAVELGYRSVVLLGDPAYYRRYGYQQADIFGISLPFDVPSEYCMVLELVQDSLKSVKGLVEYPPAFGL